MAKGSVRAGPLTDANIGEIVVYVRDFEGAVRFYHETLGLSLDRKAEGVAGLRGKSGAEIVLHHGRERGPADAPPWLLEFIVGDIEGAVSALRARGVDVSDVDVRPYGKYARFSDPEGNPLGLEEPPKAAR